ncbi:MAG: hypothetical protein HFH24_07400 [Ruminococcus sp.]|nr:hypothetical protein [Ruminococcus sp.]
MIKTDRRTQKTMNILKEIFVDLLKEKPVQSISVTELCRLADINRSTFYLHYCDIYALLEDIENDCLEEFDLFVGMITHASLPPEQAIRRILEYIYTQKEFIRLFILKDSTYDFWQKINLRILSLFKVKILQLYQLPQCMSETEFEDMLLFYASGFYAIYKKWLYNNCEEDMDVIAKKTALFSKTCFDCLLIKK